ncbi:MAG: SIR2 family protein [Dehalococcoidia bacterium]|nr:SIR2 family protein [Dehalococcoidia bacterium]
MQTQTNLDLFTVNYDCTIETLCHRLDVSYTDGFQETWSPAAFDDLSSGIRVHKLHGSLLWFHSAKSSRHLFKIPLSLAQGNIQTSDSMLHTGDEVRDALIAPTAGQGAARRAVRHPHDAVSEWPSAVADQLVVIGYSFRDAYIKDLDSGKRSRSARELQLTVIYPRADRVLAESDEHLSSSWLFSQFKDRITLQLASTGEALRAGQLPQRINQLRAAQAQFQDAHRALAEGDIERRSHAIAKGVESAIHAGIPSVIIQAAEVIRPRKLLILQCATRSDHQRHSSHISRKILE